MRFIINATNYLTISDKYINTMNQYPPPSPHQNCFYVYAYSFSFLSSYSSKTSA
jgi:hypothetical protein